MLVYALSTRWNCSKLLSSTCCMFLTTPNSLSISGQKLLQITSWGRLPRRICDCACDTDGKRRIWKILQCEDNIKLIASFGGCYIKFQVTAFICSYRASSKVHSPRLPLLVQHTVYKCYKTGLLTNCMAYYYPQRRTVQVRECGDVL